MVRGSQSCSYPTGKALATCPATSDEVSAYVKSVVPLDDSGALTVAASWPGGTSTCAAGVPTPGCPVVVTVSYPFNFAIPFVSNQTLQLSSASQMTISQ